MSAAEEQEENHWPGFVDALSTIVMVVTFLLIILAVAIFALSLNIAKVAGVSETPIQTTNMVEATEILVEEADAPLDLPTPAQFIRQSEAAIVLKFSGTTLELDEKAKDQLQSFFEANAEDLGEAGLLITAFFDTTEGGYAKHQRMGYYRAMSVRNQLLRQGYEQSQVKVFVREASVPEKIDIVEITRSQ